MKSRNIFTRRFLFGFIVIVVLTGINAVLFGYARGGANSPMSYIQKADGVLLFGAVTLLDGGYVQIDQAYSLAPIDRVQGSTEGGQFRVESLQPSVFKIVREKLLDGVKFGAGEIKQWGDVPEDSELGKQLRSLISN